jgi:hypothetical protein
MVPAAWPIANVFSLGDVLLVLGGADGQRDDGGIHSELLQLSREGDRA